MYEWFQQLRGCFVSQYCSKPCQSMHRPFLARLCCSLQPRKCTRSLPWHSLARQLMSRVWLISFTSISFWKPSESDLEAWRRNLQSILPMWQKVAGQKKKKKKFKWASLDLSKGFYCLVVVFQDASNYLTLCLPVIFNSVLPQKVKYLLFLYY